MPKNQHTYNRKIKTSSLSLPIHQSTYAWKNISSYFFCRSTGSLHTCDEGFFNTPHFYKGIQKHFYHPNFSPFTNCLQMKKKTPLTFTADSEALWANIFSLFYFCFSQRKKAPHFPWDFRSTLNTQNSHLLHFVYILSPFLKQNDIFQTLISFFEQQKIRLGFLRFLIGFCYLSFKL